MAIYRKGDDLTPLQNAADAQSKARKEAGAEVRGEAGLGGGARPRVSNLMIQASTTGEAKPFSYDYRTKDSSGKPGKVMHKETGPISGGAVAAHQEKRVRLGREEAPEKVDRNRKSSKPAGKAPVDLVRSMLGKGTLTISQAEKANKRGLSSPIKKNKKK
jgi:hypothetical protein